MDSKNDFNLWISKESKKRTLTLEEGSKEISFKLIRSSIIPGKDSRVLLESFLKAVDKFSQLDSESHPLLLEVISDKRFPGWLRLLAALRLGTPEQVQDMACYTPALAGVLNANSASFMSLKSENVSVLSSIRRLRLSDAGLYGMPKVSLGELREILTNPRDNSWQPSLDTIHGRLKFPSENLKQALLDLEVISRHVAPETYFGLLSSTVHRIESMSKDMTEQAFEALKAALKDMEESSWPKSPLMLKVKPESVKALSDGTRESIHLSAMLLLAAHDGYQASKSVSHDTIKMLANESGAWCLAKIVNNDAEKIIFTLEEVLKYVSPNNQAVKGLLSNFSRMDTEHWSDPRFMAILSQLPRAGNPLVEVAINDLGNSYGYNRKTTDYPKWVKEAIVGLNTAFDGNPAKAQAQLVEDCYVPASHDRVRVSGYVFQSLQGHLLRLVRGDDEPNSIEADCVKAWARKLSVRDFVSLVEISHDYNARCRAPTSLPVELEAVIYEALENCSSSEAEGIFLAALKDSGDLHEHMTLRSFAKEISAIIDHSND